jgi:hypothetical protein
MLGPVHVVLAAGAVGAVLSTVPFGITAMDYRHRDNGLSYILLVLGVGVWNGMFATQLLAGEPLVKTFFLTLAVVGSLLTGLGWFLFASTASRTSFVFDRRPVYATVAVLAGIDVAVVVTAPVHGVYWTLPDAAPTAGFAAVVPRPGYWLHVAFLAGLFAAGSLLFAGAWRAGEDTGYTRAYTVAGTVVAGAVVASGFLASRGLSVVPPIAVSLTTIGWMQASQGQVLGAIRAAFRPG